MLTVDKITNVIKIMINKNKYKLIIEDNMLDKDIEIAYISLAKAVVTPYSNVLIVVENKEDLSNIKDLLLQYIKYMNVIEPKMIINQGYQFKIELNNRSLIKIAVVNNNNINTFRGLCIDHLLIKINKNNAIYLKDIICTLIAATIHNVDSTINLFNNSNTVIDNDLIIQFEKIIM